MTSIENVVLMDMCSFDLRGSARLVRGWRRGPPIRFVRCRITLGWRGYFWLQIDRLLRRIVLEKTTVLIRAIE